MQPSCSSLKTKTWLTARVICINLRLLPWNEENDIVRKRVVREQMIWWKDSMSGRNSGNSRIWHLKQMSRAFQCLSRLLSLFLYIPWICWRNHDGDSRVVDKKFVWRLSWFFHQRWHTCLVVYKRRSLDQPLSLISLMHRLHRWVYSMLGSWRW